VSGGPGARAGDPRGGRWRRLVAAARELGPANTVLYALDRLLARAVPGVSLHRHYLVAQPVPEAPLLPPQRGRSIEVRPVVPGDPGLAAFPRPAGEVERRYASGAVCLGAFREGRMIGQLWLLDGPYREPTDRCVLVPHPPRQAVWDFDLEVLPDQRGGLAFARLWDTAGAYLRSRGCEWTLSRVSALNPGSLAVHRRLGARVLRSLWFVSVGRWQLLAATVPPYLHLSSDPQSAPRVTVRAP
jgi:hypothetical protein